MDAPATRSVSYGRARPLRRLLGGVVIAVLVVVAAAAALLAGLRTTDAGVLPGLRLAGEDIGGLGFDGLTVRVRDLADRTGQEPVSVSHGDTRLSATRGQLGYRMDVGATVERIWLRGRQANPLVALTDHLRARSSRIDVDPVEQVGPVRLRAWADTAADELAVGPREGTLRIAGRRVVRVEPRDGASVDAQALAQVLMDRLLDDGLVDVAAPATPLAPRTTVEDVDAVEEAARRAVSAPVHLKRNGGSITLSGAQIGRLLRVEQTSGDPALRLRADARRLVELVPRQAVRSVTADPVDAQIRLVGQRVRISPSAAGFRFVAQAATRQVLRVATGQGRRRVQLAGTVLDPNLTTSDARRLRIRRRVSTFTTYFPCCQTRVTNIQRIAQIVDGAIVRPGRTFSLNGYVGPRTTAKGFVTGGAIQNGEFVEEIGGGVSQFTTTMYNAVFFGGYEFVEYKAHSYFIDRYPAGREATLNYPTVDLKFTNDSPYGILFDTSSTGTSITVSFYSTKWADVESISGAPTNHTGFPTQVRVNPDLPKGQSVVVQSGRGGFDITVTRVLRYRDGRVEREQYFTRYLPEPQIIERGRA